MIKKSLFAIAATAAACAAAPASAATTFDDVLSATGANAYRFSFAGGALTIHAESTGSNPIGDPSIYVFEDDGSPDSALTGLLLGYNDDYNGLNSELNLNLAGGNYVLSIGRFFFSENEARSTNALGTSAGTTFTIRFNETVGLGGAVPEPSAWALLILGFGAIGAGMRRRSAARIAFA